MQTTRAVLDWFWLRGVHIKPDSILWHWTEGKLWFVAVDRPDHSLLDDTERGYVCTAHTHDTEGEPLMFSEFTVDIPMEKAPAEFRMQFKSVGSTEGERQAEQLIEIFYLYLKSGTEQQTIPLTDLVESLSEGFTNVEIVQCKKAAAERLEDENYDQLNLVKAILAGDGDAVEKCIASGSYELNSAYSPLHLATINGTRKMVASLIANGADVDQISPDGRTALHYASYSDSDEPKAKVAVLLVAGADVNAIDNEGLTPLHIASQNGRCDLARILISAGADIDCRDNDCATPLHLASENGHAEVVAMLVDLGARVNIATDNGSTPLSFAKQIDHPEIVKILAQAGAREFVRSKSSLL